MARRVEPKVAQSDCVNYRYLDCPKHNRIRGRHDLISDFLDRLIDGIVQVSVAILLVFVKYN